MSVESGKVQPRRKGKFISLAEATPAEIAEAEERARKRAREEKAKEQADLLAGAAHPEDGAVAAEVIEDGERSGGGGGGSGTALVRLPRDYGYNGRDVTEEATEDRREVVWALHCKGFGPTRIVELLREADPEEVGWRPVGRSQVSRDISRKYDERRAEHERERERMGGLYLEVLRDASRLRVAARDHGERIAAAKLQLEAADRLSRLYGLDAPKKRRLSVAAAVGVAVGDTFNTDVIEELGRKFEQAADGG